MKILREGNYYIHPQFTYTLDNPQSAEVLEMDKMTVEELEKISGVKFNKIEKALLERKDVEVVYIKGFGFVSNISPYEDEGFFLGDINQMKQYLEEKYSTEKYGYSKKLTQEELEESWKNHL